MRALLRARRVLNAAAAATALLSPTGAYAQSEPAALDDTQQAAPAVDRPDETDIVVTGSRLAPTGFSAPTPVTVLDAEQIQRLAVTNVSDALNQIPSFRAQGSRATGGVFGNNLGAQTADLRGLGSNRTLVLIDGRRVVASTVTGGSFTPGGVVDLSIVPTSILSRAEVVTGGASAAYGSDAVAGVVNLIINDRLQGIRLQAQSEISERGDNEEYMLSLAAGTSFGGGRGHIVFAAEYIDGGGVGDCYTRGWCAQSYGPIQNPSPGANGIPAVTLLPNARTATAAPGGLINAGPLRGTAFDANGNPVAYPYGTYYGGGLFMSGGSFIDRNPFFQYYSLVVPVERFNLFGNLKYDITDNVRAFLQASYSNVKSSSQQAQVREAALVIRQDNAFLPTSVRNQMAALTLATVTVGRIGNDFGPSLTSTDRDTMRIVAGLEGRLGGDWRWDAYYQFGQTDYNQQSSNNKINANFTRAIDAVVDPGSGQIVCRATLSADPAVRAAAAGCAPLNIFGENRWSPAGYAYSFGTATADIRLRQHVAALNLRGTLGPVRVAVGGEYRGENVNSTVDPISAALGFYTNNGVAVNGSADVVEGYVEAAISVFEDQAWANLLELNGAARYTHYNTVGGVATWKLGAIYEPVEGLRFRATRSRDIRAPSLFELYSPTTRSQAAVRDPVTNTQSLVAILSGGNPNLGEETANTFTAGIVLEPRGMFRGLRFSADYYDIQVDEVITSLGAQIIANQCAGGGAANICALITRDANNNITQISNPLLNLNQLHVRGIDFEALYRLSLAADTTLTLRGVATHLMKLTTIDIAGNAVNRAGMVGAPNGQVSGLPSWSFNAQATVDHGPFSLTTQVRFIAGGKYDATLLGPEDEGYSPSLTNSISTNRVPAETYVNLQFQWTVMQADDGRQLQFYGVINNLLDNQPPNYLPSSTGPTNAVLYDIVGRAYRIGVRVGF
jgi:outer membrane receptor protein involved in Fe transport